LGERYVKKNKIEGFTLIKGEEITTSKGHMLGVGLEEPIKKGLSPQETADKIKEQGGAVIAPHPFGGYGLREHLLKTKGIDAMEVFNPFYWFNSIIKLKTNYYKDFAKKHNLGQVANTDAHTLGILGRVFTHIKSEHGVDNIVKAVKNHQTSCSKYSSFFRSFRALAKTVSLTPLFWRPKPKFKG